ncbi:uncharacterized protein LOC141724389 [Apium graveolens]|uniref:uncharacterized protein LOC141724389 n=1 Tax=Apium graveolens TaxID=4045 RepID=UPI003D79B404
MLKLFDSHCHLQDHRISNVVPKLIRTTLDNSVVYFAVNGTSEKDWPVVKEMSDSYPCILPSFGIHPLWVAERNPNWFSTLKDFFEANPCAAVGEIGLDKGTRGKKVDFADQIEIFQQQLQLAKGLNRPASVHCVRAFGDLLPVMKSLGPFPAGVILHSYLGSAEMVPEFAKLGAYFSFSGYLMFLKESKAKKMLKSVPADRILLETDAPDGLPKADNLDSLFYIENDSSFPEDHNVEVQNAAPINGSSSNSTCCDAKSSSAVLSETLNHPANIKTVLAYVASLLDVNQEELADLTYENASRLFSYEGSKLIPKGQVHNS